MDTVKLFFNSNNTTMATIYLHLTVAKLLTTRSQNITMIKTENNIYMEDNLMGVQDDSIGKRIFKLRKEKKLTQEELGNALNLTQNTISKIENNDISLTLDNLMNIASYFNVSIDYICTGQKTDNILTLLEKYTKLEYRSGSCGQEHYNYPVLKISKVYFEYLMRTARAENDKYMPGDIKKLWKDKEIQTFNNSPENENLANYVEVVPVPDAFIYPNEEMHNWKQADLIKEMDVFFSTDLSHND